MATRDSTETPVFRNLIIISVKNLLYSLVTSVPFG
jgi:hypothetical protein